MNLRTFAASTKLTSISDAAAIASSIAGFVIS